MTNEQFNNAVREADNADLCFARFEVARLSTERDEWFDVAEKHCMDAVNLQAEVARMKARGDHWQAVADTAENDNARLREALKRIDRCSRDCVEHDRMGCPLLGDVAAYGSIARGALKEETK